MSNVIRFLERLGQDAAVRHADKDELSLILQNQQIEPEVAAAMLAEDIQKIEVLLDCKPNICCGVFPGKEDDESEEAPSKDDEEIQAQSAQAA
jgi:hypothetical protein